MAVVVNGSEIVLTGTVGETFWDDGFTSGEVIAALAQVGRDNPVTIRLNSGGGYATEGAAIHAALQAHKGEVTVIVEGIAASAASLIAVAGDDVAMALGAVMMIHDPSTITWGTAKDHELSVKMLNSLGSAYAETYADKTGKLPAEMRTLMQAETWMTAQEAVDGGFADRLAAANENQPEPTAFAYGIYAKAPQAILALADAKGWKPRGAKPAASAAPSPKPKETPMANQNDPTGPDAKALAAARQDATARIKAILSSDEAKGREAMASHLAYDTEQDADAAVALLKVAPKASAEATQSFEERKIAAAADGLGGPTPGVTAPAKASWKKATDRVNARVA